MALSSIHHLMPLTLTLMGFAIVSNGQEVGNPDEYVYDTDSGLPTPPSVYYPNGGIDYEEYSYNAEVDVCEQRDTCAEMRFSFLSDMLKNCYCDDLCQVYNDCCEDFEPSDPTKTYEKLPRNTYSCGLLDGVALEEGTVPIGLDTIYVVDKCPKEYEDDFFKSQCERSQRTDMFANVPVNGRATGILYKNYFCAVCHGTMDVSFLDINIGCINSLELDVEAENFTVESSMERLLSNFDSNCTLMFSGHTARYCKENVISRCHNDWKDKQVKKKCRSGTQYRYGFQKIFKNQFCAECNYVNLTYLDCTDDRQHTSVERMETPPLSILLDLNTGRGTVSQSKRRSDDLIEKTDSTLEMRRCPENHIYDPFAKICRLVACRVGFSFINGECLEDTPGVTPDDPSRKIVSSTLQSGGGFDEVDGVPTKLPMDTTTGMFNSGLDNEVESGVSTTLQERVANGIEYLDCPLVTLSASDYRLLPSGGIFVPLYSKGYDREEYANKSDGEIFICAPYTDQNYTVSTPVNVSADEMPMFQYDRIQGLISYIGLLISIICLFVVFVIYMIFPSLRNTPGKCVVSLVVALLLAQLSFLVGGPLMSYPKVCFSLGVLTHYFYLASFFWINVLCVSIFRSVSANNLSEDSTSHFICASFFAWLAAALIVGVALVLQFLEQVPDMFRPKYGEGLCWITQKWPLLITFAAPVALILVINIILFIGTTIKICTISRGTRYGRSNKDKTHEFLLYVKLCFIMGLTWIFGFVAAITGLTVLWYVFIVFNSLHGAYICFAFVCTRHVFGLLNGKGQKNKQRVTGGYTDTNSTSNGPSWARTKHSVLDTSFNGDVKVIESRETSI